MIVARRGGWEAGEVVAVINWRTGKWVMELYETDLARIHLPLRPIAQCIVQSHEVWTIARQLGPLAAKLDEDENSETKGHATEDTQ